MSAIATTSEIYRQAWQDACDAHDYFSRRSNVCNMTRSDRKRYRTGVDLAKREISTIAREALWAGAILALVYVPTTRR